MKQYRRHEKRLRDRKKRDEKLKKADAFVLSKRVANCVNKHFVSLRDIQHILKNGKVEKTSSKTFRISTVDTVLDVMKNERNIAAKIPSHLVILDCKENETKEKEYKVQEGETV